MKAMLMTATGGPEVLQLADVAEPMLVRPTEVKVRLHAAGVNPIDTKIRRRGLLGPNPLPAILGCDGAGEIVEKGPDADLFAVGDRVWFCNGGLGGDPGNYAEYTVIDQRWLVRMPERLSYEQAAAAPLVLITAWGALYDRARLREGQSVLIHAGAGGVGHVAIQLAKLRGARVLATVGSADKAAFVQGLGADETIDYRNEDFVARTNELTEGVGVDVTLDTVGPEVLARSTRCTAHFGDLVTLLDLGSASMAESRMRNHRIGFELMLTPQLRNLARARDHQIEILRRCGEWLDAQSLLIHVSDVLPLADAADAHRAIEDGHVSGKIVLRIV
ncbi:MAG: zinc-dependent alcohol dehydrogenase family protein [Methylotetracoccus sp.]